MSSKPIKRNENIAPLSRDHYAGLLFCVRLKKGVSKNLSISLLADYVQWFWNNDMKEHFESEETYLFTNPEDPGVKRALDEHKDIKGRIDEIKTLQTTDQAFLELAAIVDRHIRYEERELFPYLEAILPEAELLRIGKILLDKEAAHCDPVYSNEFWK